MIDQEHENEVRLALARRLAAPESNADISHPILALAVVAIAFDSIPLLAASIWLALIVAATVCRWWGRQIFNAHHRSDGRLRHLRAPVLLIGMLWGLGILILTPRLPTEDLALILVVLAGLISGASMTLSADRVSFYGFIVGSVGSLLIALAFRGGDRFGLMSFFLTLFFTGMIIRLYMLGHRLLLKEIRASILLERSEALLAEERNILDALFQSAPVAIVVTDDIGRTARVNPGFTRTFGYQEAEVIGRDLGEVIALEGMDDPGLVGLNSWSTGGSAIDVCLRHRDGRVILARVASAIASGTPERAIFHWAEDMTDAVAAEQALKKAEREYRELVESASDLVWRIDDRGRFTFVNAACEEFFEVPASSLLGERMMGFLDATRAEQDLEALELVLAGEQLVDYETVYRDGTGEPKHLSLSTRALRDADGQVVGAQGIGRNVTARAQAWEALEDARQAAEDAAQAKTAFLANMSHEIRTPMNGVLGMAELLLDSELASDEREMVEIIHSSGQALLSVINDVLDFSKIDAGRVELETIPFDLHKLLTSTVRILEPQADQRDTMIVLDIAPEVPRQVLGDPGRTRQVLTNLVGNAVKFTERGRIEVAVSVVGPHAEMTRVQIDVTDTGIGIAADKLDTIFEEFAQADLTVTRQYGGTGLGLAISRRLVEAMGGTLQVESEVGVGSVFRLKVPLLVGDVVGTIIPSSDPKRLAGRRVLLADPRAERRLCLTNALLEAGAVVTEADGTVKCLDALDEAIAQGATFDALIVEVHLDDGSGFELARRIQSDSARAQTPVMLVTSTGKPGDGRRARKLGISAYLTRPIGTDDLLSAVTKMLDQGPGDASRYPLITRHSLAEERRSLRILIADDHPVNRRIAEAILAKRGHEVAVVEDGAEVLEAVRRHQFDALILDMQMPRLDGFAATTAIRRIPSLKTIPIIALTAGDSDRTRARCRDAGVDGFLSKPFNALELIRLVEDLGTGRGVPTGLGEPHNRQTASYGVTPGKGRDHGSER